MVLAGKRKLKSQGDFPAIFDEVLVANPSSVTILRPALRCLMAE